MKRLALLIFLSACGGAAAVGPPAVDVAGSYELQTVQGTALPALTYDDGSNKEYTTSGSDVLGADHVYTVHMVSVFKTPGLPDVNFEDYEVGHYEVAGSTITFHTPTQVGELTFTGTLSGGVLSTTYTNLSVRFQRN